MSEKSGKTNIIHSITYADLCGFLGKATCVEEVDTYTLPVRASDYAANAAGLIEELVSYHGKDSEKWRIRMEKLQQVKKGEEGITVGKRTLYDAHAVFALAELDSFFVIPGERSMEEGGFGASDVVQLSRLVALRPLVLHLEDEVVDAEKGVWKLTGVLRDIQTEQR